MNKNVNDTPDTGEDSPSIQESLAMLDEYIQRMNDPDAGLEETFRYYEKGIKLVNYANSKIDKVEKQIRILSGEEQDGI